jgi:hypothetical protein
MNDCYVYFAITECGRYMKIGSTIRPGQRIARLNADARKYFGRSVKAQYIGIFKGAVELETKLHRRFADRRIGLRGDWYWPSAEMMEYIRSVSEYFVSVESLYLPRQGQPTNCYSCGFSCPSKNQARFHCGKADLKGGRPRIPAKCPKCGTPCPSTRGALGHC